MKGIKALIVVAVVALTFAATSTAKSEGIWMTEDAIDNVIEVHGFTWAGHHHVVDTADCIGVTRFGHKVNPATYDDYCSVFNCNAGTLHHRWDFHAMPLSHRTFRVWHVVQNF